MTEDELRLEVCRVGASLFARGYVHGSTGNISARLDDGFLITATDACLGTLSPSVSRRSTLPAGRWTALARARRWRCIAASTRPTARQAA